MITQTELKSIDRITDVYKLKILKSVHIPQIEIAKMIGDCKTSLNSYLLITSFYHYVTNRTSFKLNIDLKGDTENQTYDRIIFFVRESLASIYAKYYISKNYTYESNAIRLLEIRGVFEIAKEEIGKLSSVYYDRFLALYLRLRHCIKLLFNKLIGEYKNG
jgi:hypothetical protein